ncbi:MAG: bacteriohemerythrin [Thiogranum sp.]
MPGLVLTRKYLTGIQKIDAQHQVLVDMINELGDALTRNDGRESTGDILRKLIEYTESHFKTEEDMLRAHDYPDFSQHVASHKGLIRRITTFEDMFRRGVPNIGAEVLHFLQEWLFSHILKTDMAYVPCVTGHTLTDPAAGTAPRPPQTTAATIESPSGDTPGADSFVLTDDLLTGIDAIDAQHGRLFDLANKLNAAIAQGKSRAMVGKTIDELVEYTRTHFSAEEAMLARCHYPQIEQHKRGHEKLLHRVLVFKNMYERGIPNIESEILCFLKDWLLNHIRKTDMEYVPFTTQTQEEAVVS